MKRKRFSVEQIVAVLNQAELEIASLGLMRAHDPELAMAARLAFYPFIWSMQLVLLGMFGARIPALR